MPKGAEDDQVQTQTDETRHDDRRDGRGHQAPGIADRDRVVHARNEVQQLTLSEQCVDVGCDERDAARSEVDDARAAIGQDESQRQRGEYRAVTQSQHEEGQVLRHGAPPGRRASLPGCC